MDDLKFGVRMLLRWPGTTLLALATLALGIGANTAIFSIVNTVMLRPLPFADPTRIVVVGDRNQDGTVTNIGYTTYYDIKEQSAAFEALAVMRSWSPTLAEGGEAERLPAVRVSAGFFSMLGIQPRLGRDFTAAEDTPDGRRVIILSDALWRRRFGADPNVIGRTVTMNDVGYRVVGVMPSEFEPLAEATFYQRAEIWAPVGYDLADRSACRSCQHLKAIGRLRRDVMPDQAAADLNTIRSRLKRAFPGDYSEGQMAAVPLGTLIARPVRMPLLILLGAVGFVLLIACANVANLLLSRTIDRSREIAIRSALGAARGRLMRQLLTESTLLAVAGGAVGVALAAVSVRSVGIVAPVTLPRLDRIGIDRWVLAFSFGLSLLTGLVFGLLPAVRGSRLRLRDALASDARTAVGGGSGRVRALLVVTDLALSLVLLTGAALMLQSVRAMMRADPGFNADGVVTAQFSLVGTAYREDAAVLAFQNRLLERVSALPGVEAAALAGQVPMGKNYDTWGFHIEGLMSANAADDPSVQRYSVSPDYFKALRIPLRRGRLLSTSDTTNSLPVVVVSESTAALWPGGEPLGRRVRIGGPSAPWRTVVGVVADVRHASLDEGVSTGMYLPQTQITDSYLVLAVRTRTTHPERLIPEIRSALAALDPTVPVYDIARLDELVAASFADRRFVTQLLSAFSTLALLLAAIGVYGVVSYSVSRRTRELGLRVALGARNADIVRLVLSGGAGTLAAGIGLGMAGAFATTRVLNAMLFGVSASDPAAMITSTIMLVGVTLAAHWLPVSRALRIDPSVALRQD